MSTQKTDAKPQPKKDHEKALAVLIKNTKTGHRYLSLPEIADWLDIAIKAFGGLRNVADKIGLSSKMLRQFQYIKTLPPTVQELFASRQIDSVDIAVHLSMMGERDQFVISKEIASGRLDSADVRAIHELRKEDPKMSIQAIVDRVRASKNIKQYVAEFVLRNKAITKKLLKKRLGRVVGDSNLVSLEVKGSFGSIVLTPEGKRRLDDTAREKRASRGAIINAVVRGALD